MRKMHIATLMLLVMLSTFVIGNASAQVWTIADLWAGQHTPVGWVFVVVDSGDLVVSYEISGGGWEIGKTHLYVGTEAPRKHSPGKFPYKHAVSNVIDQYIIPLSDVGAASGDIVYIAAHATVSKLVGWEPGDPGEPCTPIYQVKTAWAWPSGRGIPFDKTWAMYFSVTIP